MGVFRNQVNFNCGSVTMGLRLFADQLTFRSAVPAAEMSLIAWDSFQTRIC